MGNQQPSKQGRQEGQQEYSRLGFVKVKQISDESGETISMMSFSRLIQNEKIWKSWSDEVLRVFDSESKEILLLPQKHFFEKAGLCGSGGYVHLTYEDFPYVLDSEIKNRKQLGRFFEEAEMWYLLYNMIRTGDKFEKMGKKIGDVTPHNIVINEEGQIKVICTCSIPNQLDNFQKIIEDKNAQVFLAPQQLNEKFISKCQYPENVDQCKAEVFSIGLTILSSGILEDCHQVYNGLNINEPLVNQLLQKFRSHYSPYLFATLVSMLNFDPKNRKKCSEIYIELFPYENSILELQAFTPPMSQTHGSQYLPQSQYPSQIRQSLQRHELPNQYLNYKSQYPSVMGNVGNVGNVIYPPARSTYQGPPTYAQRI